MAEQKNDRPNSRRSGGRPTPPNGGMRFGRGLFGWFIFIALCIVLFILLNKNNTQYVLMSRSDVTTQQENAKSAQISLEAAVSKLELKQPVAFGGQAQPIKHFKAEVPPNALSGALLHDLLKNNKGATIAADN